MLQMIKLNKVYENFQLDITLQIPEGSVVGLIGQNGAGKTTTFKAILDLIDIDSGSIQIFGKDYKQLTKEDKMKIGVVLNDAGFSDFLTIKGVVRVMEAMYTEFDCDHFLKKCKAFQLPCNKKIKEFSTGMKAKLKLLLAMHHGANLLILDEPTAGLDVIARDELLDMLREFMEDEHHSILISSHISSDLESLCDEVYMIQEGRIVLQEETDVLLSSYGVIKLDEKQYQAIDKQYILNVKKENFGYRCLTNEKQFYLDNYPNVVIEKGSMDEVIMMIVKGEPL